jgi:hypothetical protein
MVSMTLGSQSASMRENGRSHPHNTSHSQYAKAPFGRCVRYRAERALLPLQRRQTRRKRRPGSSAIAERRDPVCAKTLGRHIHYNSSFRNVNWQKSTSECRQEVQAALKRMLDLSGRVPSHLQAQLDTDEYDMTCRPDSPFIPLFPRKTLSARKKSVAADIGNELNSLAALSAYLPPQISTEELDKDLFNDNMRVIDDWGKYMRYSI